MDLSNLFNGRDLEEDNNFDHISKDVKKSKLDKSSRKDNEKYLSGKTEIKSFDKHSLFFRKEKRRGKIVTMVGYIELSNRDKKELLSFLKKKLSCGGSIRGDFFEFQGDFEVKVKEEMLKKGFKFRK